MAAVADSGPLIHLAQAGHIPLLRSIFGEVLIVPAVKREVVDEGVRRAYPDAKLVAEALAEGYIVVHKISSRASKQASKLSREEKISQSDAETLRLAHTSQRPLLTDERNLSRLARMYGLEVWNTWTILLEALRRKLIDEGEVGRAIRELGEKRHKLSSSDTKEILDAAARISAAETV